MATGTILADLPLSDKMLPPGGLLRDLEAARQELARQRAALQLSLNEQQGRMDAIDDLIATISSSQVLLSKAIEAGLLPLDFEAVAG